MSQTAYSINIANAAYPGQPYDTGKKDDVTVVAFAAALPYGVLVVYDAANGSPDLNHRNAIVPATTGSITTAGNALGVVVADQARAQEPLVTNAVYDQYSAVPVRRQGRIWVVAETAVTDNAPCFVRFATGTGTQLGAFRADADSASAVALPNAKFVGTTSAAGFAVVELNLT